LIYFGIKRFLLVGVLLAIGAIVFILIEPSMVGKDGSSSLPSETIEAPPVEPELVRYQIIIKPNTTAENILPELGFDKEDVYALIRDIRPVY